MSNTAAQPATPQSSDLPAVSVVVPVFNREAIVTRAIGSLLAQDFSLPFEIVVVDDGSSDDTVARAEAAGERVHVIRQTNQGAAAARRNGVLAARAEVVTFLDSDDIALPHRLSTLWEGLHRRTGIVASFAAAADIAAPDAVWPLSCAGDMNKHGIVGDPLATLLLRGCFVPSMNFMTYRRLALQESEGRQHVVAANDYDLFLRIACHGPFAGTNISTQLCERRSDGISLKRGAYQAAFALIASNDAVRLSGRRDAPVRGALRFRVEEVWPSALILTLFQRRWRLAATALRIGLTRARWVPSGRRLWWAFLDARGAR